MRDPARDLQAVDLGAEPACCPGGMCGPIFETPLLELAFIRIRDLFRGRKAAGVVETTLHHQLPAAQAVAAAPPHPRKDAPYD